MHNNYSLKYRTFNQLFEDVTVDFRNYALEGKIDPQPLLKIVRKVNYKLGFRIYRTMQVVLEIEHGKVRLPDDFYILNYALVCGTWEITEALPQGTHVEEVLIKPPTYTCPQEPDPCAPAPDPCDTPDPCGTTCLTKCGEEYQLVQKIKTTTRTFKQVFPLYLKEDQMISCDCPNTKWQGAYNEGYIKDGFLYVNFDSGKVYLNYMGDMVDEEGNILVPDHELINEYYEYALKDRILENLIMNDENVSEAKITLIKQGLRESRNNAMSIVNMPNFAELKKIWQTNRKAQYHNYYNMFRSHFPFTSKPFGL